MINAILAEPSFVDRLHCIHRFGARFIGAFVLLHIVNHLFAIYDVSAHIQAMEALRHLYRAMAWLGEGAQR